MKPSCGYTACRWTNGNYSGFFRLINSYLIFNCNYDVLSTAAANVNCVSVGIFTEFVFQFYERDTGVYGDIGPVELHNSNERDTGKPRKRTV